MTDGPESLEPSVGPLTLPRPTLQEGDLSLLRSPKIIDLARHYVAIRGNRLMPSRRDIDPMAIPHLLAHVWMWAFDGETGEFRLRLAGEVVAQRFRNTRRGTTLDAFLPASAIGAIRSRYIRVVRTPSAVHAIGASIVGNGYEVFSERLLLPLSDDGHTGDGLIGLTVYDETSDARLGFVRESGTVETWIALA
jgi:hypothetical protein